MLRDLFDLEDGALFEHNGAIYEKVLTVTDSNCTVQSVTAKRLLFKSGDKWVFNKTADTENFNPYATVQPVKAEFPHI